MRLEDARRSIPGCAGVTLPYWDETRPESRQNGIPWALTRKDFMLDGETIANPLRSFVLNRDIVDHLSPYPDAIRSRAPHPRRPARPGKRGGSSRRVFGSPAALHFQGRVDDRGFVVDRRLWATTIPVWQKVCLGS